MGRRRMDTTPRAEEIDLEGEPPSTSSAMPHHDAGAAYARAVARLPAAIRQPLVELLAPHDLGTFFRTYWDRRALHIRGRRAPRRFAQVLSLETLLELFRHNRVPPHHARFSRQDGGAFSDTHLRDGDGKGLFRFDAVFGLLRRASGSVVLNHLNDYHPPANELTHALAEIFRCVVKVNAYFSPRESRLFPLHWDTHDAFILQAQGAKEWHVYDPVVPLPLEGRHASDGFEFTARGRRKLVMRPGDVLFIPRGVPHQAFAKETDSLHLTIGVHVPTWVTVVEALVARATAELARDAHARGSSALLLDPRDRESAAYASRVVQHFARTLRGLDARATLREAAAAQHVVTCPEGVDLSRTAPIEPGSHIVRAPGVHFLVDAPGGPELLFDGKRLRFGRRARAALELITARRTFRVSELPRAAPPAQNLALVTRLVAEGFLHVERPAEAPPAATRGGRARASARTRR